MGIKAKIILQPLFDTIIKIDEQFFECSFKKPLKLSDIDKTFLIEFLPVSLNANAPYGCIAKFDGQNSFVDCSHIKIVALDKPTTLFVAYPVEQIQETIKENKYKLSRTATTITLSDGKNLQKIYNMKDVEILDGILTAYTNHSTIFDCGELIKCNLDSGGTTSFCMTKNKEVKPQEDYPDKVIAFFESVKAKYFSAAKNLLSDNLKQNMQNEHLSKFFESYGKIEQNIFSNTLHQYILYPNCIGEKLAILEIKIIDNKIDNFFILD